MAFLKNIQGNSLTDAELVLLYKQTEDLHVLGELYQRYMDLVYGVCLKYFKEPERSKDAVMKIFEELMQLRTPKNLKTVEIPETLMQSEEDVHLNGVLEKEKNFLKLEYCLTTLSEDQRKAVRLFYFEGKCYNEIVELMGQDWKQVRSFIQNGRRNLKICMEKSSLESGVQSQE